MRETLKGNTHFFFSKNSVLVVIMMKIFLIGIVCYFSILSSFAQKNDFYVIDYEHAEEKEILMSDLFEKVEKPPQRRLTSHKSDNRLPLPDKSLK